MRAASQALHRPAGLGDPADVVRLAGPIQAQEPRAARLAFRARARRLTGADVDRARTEERSIFRAWVMRRTAHLFATEDAAWMLPIFAPTMVPWSRRRLTELGFDADAQERGLDLIRSAIESEGPLTRPELVERLLAAGLPGDTQAKYHLWTLATLAGGLCLGPDRDGLTCLVPIREWIGELPAVSREDALAELARRYFRGYGPASERDLARWSGLPLRDARAGTERVAAELDEVAVGGEAMLRSKRARRAPARPMTRLLGAYDNFNLGYESRDFHLPAEHSKRVVPGGGIVRAVIVVDGEIAGTWSSKRSGERLAVTLEPFAPLGEEVEATLAAEVADVGRFEGVSATLT